MGEREEGGRLNFLASASISTTGTKGTVANVHGIKAALKQAMGKIGRNVEDISLVRLNEAAPVIGDTAMETLTETIITDSSMIGHNPSTPAGAGQAVGELLVLENLYRAVPGKPYIVVISRNHSYEEAAEQINRAAEKFDIKGLILQADEAVLVENRLNRKIPIIDEVSRIDRVPDGERAAIEVALAGQTIRMLSNPYGIATLLELDAEETRTVTPIAKSLIGKRSAVVIKTPGGDVKEHVLPAGEIYLDASNSTKVNLDEGAERIMKAVADAGTIRDISGQANTNVGNMLARIKKGMGEISGEQHADIRITDLLAVDTLAPVLISGALAGETCLEKAVGIAAMVKTQQLPMREIAGKLKEELGTEVVVAGVEAVMASLGALTTPGTRLPLAILDMGGGSTDAAVVYEDGHVVMTHQAGAGELVSMLIETELGLNDRHMAEQIKRYPLAKVESLFHIRHENGTVEFFQQPLDPNLFAKVVILKEGKLLPLEGDWSMEKIRLIRQQAKQKVFVTNAIRALTRVSPTGNVRDIQFVVLVGGSALDFEVPQMVTDALSQYKVVAGRGNIRGTEGPRNAVATGLVLSLTEGRG